MLVPPGARAHSLLKSRMQNSTEHVRRHCPGNNVESFARHRVLKIILAEESRRLSKQAALLHYSWVQPGKTELLPLKQRERSVASRFFDDASCSEYL